jgi:RimJ/RimL family protein N-acetyltransferase
MDYLCFGVQLFPPPGQLLRDVRAQETVGGHYARMVGGVGGTGV